MIRFSHLLLASALSLSALAASAAAGHAPAIVAHRGGTADAPENTRIAIETALKNGADAIWITLQESKDGVIVLYRPSDLKTLTNRQGPVSAYTAAQLAEIDAGWAFAKGDAHPFRGQGIGIPRLDDVLKAFPHITFYLDIKSPDADPAQFGKALLATLESTRLLYRRQIPAGAAAGHPTLRKPRRDPHAAGQRHHGAPVRCQTGQPPAALVRAGAEARGGSGGEIYPRRRAFEGVSDLG